MNNSSVLMEQLVRISDVLDWSAENAASYNLAIAILKEMTGAVLAPTFLLDATATELVLLADDEFSRLPPAFETMPAWMHVRQPWVNSQEWPVSAADHLTEEAWTSLPDDFREWFGESGIVLSLHTDGTHLGAILLCFDGPFQLTPELACFFANVGRILGSYLHAQHIRARDREIGALQERRRIGDELHAGLSQDIAAIGLSLEGLKLDLAEDWKQCKGGKTSVSLENLDSIVGVLKTELRQQMLSLRADADLGARPLIDEVTSRVRTFAHTVCVTPSIEHTQLTTYPVPLSVTSQLIRVLQESLNNIQVHAQATHVTVSLHEAQKLVRLEIADDGCGFSPDEVSDTRLGLRIMRERLAQVRGTLTIQSEPGAGTRVIASVPVDSGREVAVL
ncbi:sensor histidine kinase [Changpingibacter yushuensis]|uniref:sensor histidine kinase n=1 Tax=Changpingibacter yushuensis TaxID=2758440 RepID=UPI00165E68A7|nr:ATP-binding protein [Changpingibacter yushuensis]